MWKICDKVHNAIFFIKNSGLHKSYCWKIFQEIFKEFMFCMDCCVWFSITRFPLQTFCFIVHWRSELKFYSPHRTDEISFLVNNQSKQSKVTTDISILNHVFQTLGEAKQIKLHNRCMRICQKNFIFCAVYILLYSTENICNRTG